MKPEKLNVASSSEGVDGWRVIILSGVFVLLLTVVVYLPGLGGSFIFDDHSNILENAKLQIDHLGVDELEQALSSGGSGPLGRPVSMLSFALNYYFSGFDAYWFKFTNLAIHIVSGCGLFFLSLLLLRCSKAFENVPVRTLAWVSIIVAAIWLLHPLNLTAVLYVVQRMAGLSAMFSIFSMLFYTWGRWRQINGRSGTWMIILAITVFPILSILSKENGVLLFAWLFLIEWMVLNFRVTSGAQRLFLRFFSAVVVIGAISIVFIFGVFYSDWLAGIYDRLGMDFFQRIMTNPRVLMYYIRLILVPDITEMGLYHDDFQPSLGWGDPWETLFAALALVALLLVSLIAKGRWSFLGFGVLFFLVGHAVETSVLPLELIHEHRNYLPDFGVIIAVVVGFFSFFFSSRPQLLKLVAVLFITVLAVGTAVRARTWANLVDMTLVMVEHHPKSLRSNVEVGGMFFALVQKFKGTDKAPEYFSKARHYYKAAIALGERRLTPNISLLLLNDQQGMPVDQELLKKTAEALAMPPVYPSSISSVVELGDCQLKGLCHLPLDALYLLYFSILSNEKIVDTSRVQILTMLVKHEFAAGHLANAAELARKAANVGVEDAQINLNYAKMLIALGKLGPAQEQIDMARKYDSGGFYSHKIAVQQQVLNATRKN